MIRKVIKIDQDKCIGCELCTKACKEGAIGMVNGKATLLRDDYCDGLGNCLPVCPTNAISFEEREAAEFDKAAVEKHMASKNQGHHGGGGGCPGSRAQAINRGNHGHAPSHHVVEETSQLGQWPVQIKLVPVNAPYFDGANLLVAADCTAYAYAGFHSKFMKNKITIIGCPKLDEGDYADKLTAILQANEIKSVTVARMEVPCCGGIENAVKRALMASGKMIPWQIVTISTDGQILDN